MDPTAANTSTADRLTFVGTATTLLTLGAFTVLTDPNFLHRGQRAYLGKGLWSRRLTDPALEPEDVPALDAVLLSHLHGDHFDRVARARLSREQPVITTPHAADRLTRWGFRADGLETWQEVSLRRDGETLTVTALPAVHARGVMGRLLPPVMGSMVEHAVSGRVRRRIYVSGDTLTGDHLDEIARRYPSIDLAVVHLGGTRVLWHTVTLDDRQGLDLLDRVRPAGIVPVHFDDYRVFRSPLSAFEARVRGTDHEHRVRTVRRGETVRLDDLPAAA